MDPANDRPGYSDKMGRRGEGEIWIIGIYLNYLCLSILVVVVVAGLLTR